MVILATWKIYFLMKSVRIVHMEYNALINGSILAELSDVSKDYGFVKWAAGRFTEFQLNPEHIEDAIENAYIEYYEIL